MIEILEYRDRRERSIFRNWADALDNVARLKITVALDRLSEGNTGALKSVGGGVHELRIHFGPGYRIYLGREGDRLIILLCGGDKTSQKRDIVKAKELWEEHKQKQGRSQ